MGKYSEQRKKGLKPFQKGQSGNPNGRPKGSKNLSTIIRELEDESFDWKMILKDNKELHDYVKSLGSNASPWRVIVYKALVDALVGKPRAMIAAREWLSKACYGNKVEATKIERERIEPIIISEIKPRASEQ